jgi:hypothetical protein
MRDNGRMADDEIERLLREIDATTTPPTSAAGSDLAKGAKAPAVPSADGGGRLAFAVVAAVGGGALTFGFGAFLWLVPFINPSALDLGVGGAIAGFVTGLVAGPPRWFSK